MNWHAVIKGETETVISDQLGIIVVAQGLPGGGGKEHCSITLNSWHTVIGKSFKDGCQGLGSWFSG